jgi:hypothetical protein
MSQCVYTMLNMEQGESFRMIKVKVIDDYGIVTKFKIPSDATTNQVVKKFEDVLVSAGYVFDQLEVHPLTIPEERFVSDYVDFKEEDSSYPTAFINDVDEVWDQRIEVHGKTKEEAKDLAERICYLLNKYGLGESDEI